MGFLGSYSAVLNVLPGMPEVEASQFYIILAVYKTFLIKQKTTVFYNRILTLTLLYVIFLVIIGQLFGVRGGLNVNFRIMKLTIPLLLFYAIPNLLRNTRALCCRVSCADRLQAQRENDSRRGIADRRRTVMGP